MVRGYPLPAKGGSALGWSYEDSKMAENKINSLYNQYLSFLYLFGNGYGKKSMAT